MYEKIDLSRLEMILTQKSSISTWIFSNFHVGKKHSPRGYLWRLSLLVMRS